VSRATARTADRRAIPRQRPVDPRPWPLKWAWQLIVASVPAIAWFISSGTEAFRLPKELLLRSEAALLAALAIAALLVARDRVEVPRDRLLIVLAAIVGWTAIATAASTNRAVSVESMINVVSCAVVFAATFFLAGDKSITTMWVVLLAAIPNAMLHFLQEFHLWNPLFTEEELRGASAATSHLYSTALIGNPDDVGCWFVAPTLVAGALFVCQRRQRLVHGALVAVFMAVLFTGRSVTAIVATMIGLLLMTTLVSRRRGAAAALLAIVVLAAATAAYSPLRERVAEGAHLFRRGDYDALLTNRGTAFFAAALMTREHPLLGVGPGCFGFHYYEYKLRVEERHPMLLRSGGRGSNFGEVHNDHLQTMAVAGVPAYVLLLGFAFLFAKRSFAVERSNDGDPRWSFVRLFAFPFAASMLIVMAAQFPLELASTLSIGMFVCAVSAAWSLER
jgi:O-antigen ligase